jgi:AcrR family transcriptional regulator
MKPARKKSKPPAAAPKLTRDDWLDAAFGAVVEGGFDAVRVLTLAQRLGVTRGSFYWHFADHAALVDALLQLWRERELQAERQFRADVSDDPRADLERLLQAALAHAGADLENMRFELALRGLGRRDAKVAAMLAEIDGLRMALFVDMFKRLGQAAKNAGDLASLFYLCIVGSRQALSRPSTPPNMKEYLHGIIARHLIRR